MWWLCKTFRSFIEENFSTLEISRNYNSSCKVWNWMNLRCNSMIPRRFRLFTPINSNFDALPCVLLPRKISSHRRASWIVPGNPHLVRWIKCNLSLSPSCTLVPHKTASNHNQWCEGQYRCEEEILQSMMIRTGVVIFNSFSSVDGGRDSLFECMMSSHLKHERVSSFYELWCGIQ